MCIDVDHVKEVITRAGGCASGTIEISLDSLDFNAVRIAVQAGHLDWIANGTARITADGRAFLAQPSS